MVTFTLTEYVAVHLSSGEACQNLNERFGNKCIDREGPVIWLPRSPDLALYVSGYLNDFVYVTEINTEDELWQRIVDACQ